MNLDQFTEIQSRYGKDLLSILINDNAPELKKQGGYPRQTIKQGVVQINPTNGWMDGGPIADGASYDFSDQPDIDTLFAHRKIWVGITKVPIGKAEAVNDPADGIRLLEQYKQMQMGSLLKKLAQSIYSKTLGTATANATVTTGAVTVSLDDVTRFVEGSRVAYNDNGTVNAKLFTVGEVTYNADGKSGSVAFTCSTDLNSHTITASEDSFEIHDSTNSRNLTSLDDLAGSGNVYTQQSTIAGWKGTELDASGADYTSEMVLKLISHMRNRGNVNPGLILMSEKIAERHRAMYGSSTFRRFNGDAGGQKLDPYGDSAIEIAGVKVFVSPNVPARKVYVIDPRHVKLGVFKDWDSLMGDKPRVSETGYNYLFGEHGHFEQICRQRKAVGVVKNIG